MRATNRIIVVLATLLLGLFSIQSFSQSDNANPAAFGIGNPERISDLPDSAFRRNLLLLPPKSRATALKWMQGVSFPSADVASLRVDRSGGIYYADTVLPPEAESAEADTPIVSEAIPETEIFRLHSRPGSSNVLFLDFDGHTITSTAWNNSTGTTTLVALPFDPSSNDSPATVANFTSDELNRIGQMWHRISEDLSPFDIDVTTEEPASFTRTTGRLLFTHDTDANGAAMPSQNAGGVAYLNVFGNSNYATYYSPALVYYTNLYTNQHGDATLNAEAGSHEFGHNVALGHDGNSSTTYYGGHGSGFVRWGPIMGGSYQDHVSQWSKGEYSGANNTQDDLSIIAGDLGYIADDHGDTSATSTKLVVEPNGDVLVSSPELDPHNDLPTNKGIINDRTDADWFYIDVGAGPLTLVATPSWHSFTNAPYRGSNLDIEMTLFNSTLTQLDIDDPADETFATVALSSATTGRYYVRIDGVGNANYSDYNSMGMYFIEGNVTPVSLDSTIPSPSPMSFAASPAATGAYSITMTATTATDDSGYIEYQFVCQAGGGACVSSGWQTATSYAATGLDPNTLYSYVVRARDSSQNTTLDSGSASATTDLAPPVDPTGMAGTALSTTEINLTWADNSDDETGFKLERQADQGSWQAIAVSLAPNTTAYSDSGLTASTLYHYRVSAFNTVGVSGFATADAITFDLPPDGAPSGLAATMLSSSAIDVVWTDVASNATSFVVQHSSVSSSGPWSTIGSVNPGTEQFQDTGLNPNTQYWYQVYASNSGGPSSTSNVDSATTDFECRASQPMTSGEWVFFSLPCMPANPSASTIFTSGPVSGDYYTRWMIYTYDSTTQAWALLGANDALLEGKGYLYYSVDAFAMVEVAGSLNTGDPISLSTGPDPGIWTLVGNPHNGPVDWNAISVNDGSQSYGWAKMDEKRGNNPYYCEKTPSVDAKCIMWHVMNKWEGSAYVPYDGLGTEPGTLNAFETMWVLSHRSVSITMPNSDATAPLLLNAPPLLAGSARTKPARGKKIGNDKNSTGEWFARLVAESGDYRDAGNWLGQVKNAEDGLDSRDLEEWTPFSSPYLSILFTNPDFTEVDWGYTTDYRQPTRKQTGEWSFMVRASSGISEVTLSLEGNVSMFDRILLKDEISGETITVVPSGSYTFDMSGNEHPFRIIFN